MSIDAAFVDGVDTMAGLERRAQERVLKSHFDFVSGAAGDELAMIANVEAFRRYTFRPRVLTGVSLESASSQTVLFGETLEAPIYVCPMGGQKLFHPDGELATAGATRAAGLAYAASAGSSFTLEEIAAVAGPRWFQLYWQSERAITQDLLGRAAAAGFRAILLTVDAPIHSERPRDLRNGFRRPIDVPFANLAKYGQEDIGQQSSGLRHSATMIDTGPNGLTWNDLEWLRSVSPLPILLKGILTGEDAIRAVELGLDGVVVSNHGGRQLDRAPAAITVLEEVVLAADGRIPVLFDGGVRRPADVIVALALGAKAVGIGRPVLWAVACGGESFVEAMLRDTVRQLRRLLVLIGAADAMAVSRAHVIAT